VGHDKSFLIRVIVLGFHEKLAGSLKRIPLNIVEISTTYILCCLDWVSFIPLAGLIICIETFVLCVMSLRSPWSSDAANACDRNNARGKSVMFRTSCVFYEGRAVVPQSIAERY
jgi:hypothetical protein